MDNNRLEMLLLGKGKNATVRLAAQDIANGVTREEAVGKYKTQKRVFDRRVVENVVAGDLINQQATAIRRTEREVRQLLPLDPSLADLWGLLGALKKIRRETGDFLDAPGVYVIVFHDKPESTKVGKADDLVRRIKQHRANGRELTLHAYFHPVNGESAEEFEAWSKEQLREYRTTGDAREMYDITPEYAIDVLTQHGKQMFP